MSEFEWKSCENKDGNVPCEIPAHVSYVWPGQPRKYACLLHADGIARVAHAIGLPMHFEKYEGGIVRSSPSLAEGNQL